MFINPFQTPAKIESRRMTFETGCHNGERLLTNEEDLEAFDQVVNFVSGERAVFHRMEIYI